MNAAGQLSGWISELCNFLQNQAIAKSPQLLIAQRRADIGADEAAAFKEVRIGDIFTPASPACMIEDKRSHGPATERRRAERRTRC